MPTTMRIYIETPSCSEMPLNTEQFTIRDNPWSTVVSDEKVKYNKLKIVLAEMTFK